MDDNDHRSLRAQDEAEAFFRRLGRHLLSDSPWDPHEHGREVEDDTATNLPPGSVVGRYRVLARIGAGGMGTVYRARDEALEREVALKLPPAHLAADPEARERFFREARAAAGLDHPNVCTVHEVGEAGDGRPFLAMALYRGETLKDRIARGPLPVEDALAVAEGIARGLGAAHARGIVHRDVKPGNVILLPDGGVKLLDFGLAKATDTTVTRPGHTPGTVAYMSPEQVGGGAVDHRSDLWSLGVVLYEMLTGVRPFRGEGDRVVLHAIAHLEPEEVRAVRPEVPKGVARVVERLLRKDPEARCEDADRVLLELGGAAEAGSVAGVSDPSGSSRPPMPSPGSADERRGWPVRHLGLSLGALLVIAAVVRLGFSGGSPPSLPGETPTEPQRILVADFGSFTPDPLLGDAVSQALRIDLARSPGLRVAGAAAVAGALTRMRQSSDTPLHSDLARELAVREGIPAVIDGEVRRVGARYVISVALLEPASGEVIYGWRETAADSLGILSALNRLSRAIQTGIGGPLPLSSREEQFFPGTTASLEALRAFSQGHRAFVAGDLARAGPRFQEAARIDPTFALAHWMAALTLTASGRGQDRWGYVRAYRLREGLPPNERLAVEGIYHRTVSGDLPLAIEAFRNQVEAAKPTGDAVMYASLGEALSAAADLRGAESVLREAREVYPTALNQAMLVEVLHRQGKLAEAVGALEAAEGLFPGHPRFLRIRAWLAATSGDLTGADSLASHLPSTFSLGSGRRLRAQVAAVEGRVGDGLEHLAAAQEELLLAGNAIGAADVAVTRGRLRLVQGLREAAVAEVDAVLSVGALDSLDPADRPYLSLIRFFADAGEPARARTMLHAYEREVPEIFHGADRREYLRASAALRIAEGDTEGALSDLGDAGRTLPGNRSASYDRILPIRDRPEMARAWERAGQPDSAVAVLERYLAHSTLGRIELDGLELPAALFRLGELYEAHGELASAASHYLRFAELWRGADPDLQPRVEEALARASSGDGE